MTTIFFSNRFRLFCGHFPLIMQHSGHADLSTSPDTTFTHATYSCHRKLSMITNLLPEPNSTASSLDETNGGSSNNCSGGLIDGAGNSNDKDVRATRTQSKCDSQSQRDAKSLAAKQDSLAHTENNRNNNMKLSNVDNSNRKAGGYLIAVHRKLSRQDTYFLSYHKTRPSLFGVPLLIPCYEDGSNKDLYCAVWVQVARLLSPLPSTPPDQANHATDW